MKLIDVNVLVAVFRGEHAHHKVARGWLEKELRAGTQLALTPVVTAGFVRVVTNTQIHPDATPLDLALRQMAEMLDLPTVVNLLPGPRNWELFVEFCRDADARGNLASDAAIAAIAVEHGATVVSFDRDFALFSGVRRQVPGD